MTSSAADNRLQALHDHLHVLASDIHVEKGDNPDAIRLRELIDSFGRQDL